MTKTPLLAVLALALTAIAQRPPNISICDYYTTALLKDNNATNQYTLLTLLVNTAIIGNYTKPNVGVKVNGILAPSKYNGTEVNLLPFFDGALESSNRGGKGVAVNFLDDGGAAPLTMNKPAYGTTSHQYELLTHLYEYFGILLGCSYYAKAGYPAYSGDTSMNSVHKFMALDAYQVGYFIQQVALSAKSFGVADTDINEVGTALGDLFGQKCAAPTKVVPSAQDELQAICVADDCPSAPNPTCSAYSPVVQPAHASESATASGTQAPSGSSSPTLTSKSGAGRTNAAQLSACAGLVLAGLLCLA